MVTTIPKVEMTGRYSTAEACRLLGVHRNTLMKYTKEGCIRFGVRRATNRRFYLGSEILRFWKSVF